MRSKYIVSIRFNSDLEVANRCNIDLLSESWIKKRLEIFNRYTRKSLEMQTNQDFIAILSVHKDSIELVNKVLNNYPKLPNNIIFTTEKEQLIEEELKGYDNIYLIALDSDDMYHPNFIQYLHEYPVEQETHFLQVCRGYVYNALTKIVGEYYSPSSPFYVQIFSVEDYMNSIRYYNYVRHYYIQHFSPKIINEKMCMVILHDSNSWQKYEEKYPDLFGNKQILPNWKQSLQEYGIEGV